MSTMLVAPDKVVSNPWQTRTTDDPAHIASLADSIRENGLLQTPLARLTTAGKVAELAFGHSRLAAWKIARPGEAFPLEIRALSDRQMSDLAAEENTRRKNLSAIETAKAIQRRIDDFGLSQLEAGKPFGYTSQGGVANVLRLLKLPEAVQDAVTAGELPERMARQLITVSSIAKGTQVRDVVKRIGKAAPDEREHVLREGLFDLIDQHGQDLSNAAFDLAWPGKAIPVTHKGGEALDDLTELRACRGCPHLFRYESAQTCLLPACYELKQSLSIDQAITRAEKKIGVFKAYPSWMVIKLLDDQLRQFGYDTEAMLRKLINAKKNTQLGLCLVAYPQGRWWLKDVTGSNYVAVGTTDLPAVQRFLAEKTGAKLPASAKAAPATPAAARAQEEAERDERREQRARDLRLEHDIVWLVIWAAEWIGAQLKISGGILVLVQEELEPQAGPMMGEFQGLHEFRASIAHQIEDAGGKPAEELRRRHLAFALLAHECFSSYMKQPMSEWRTQVEKTIKELASNGPSPKDAPWQRAGLSVKLPATWNKPPIHHTAYNCWECGVFASNRKLTKRDQAEGWVAVYEGELLVNAYCPNCTPKGKALIDVLTTDAAPATSANGHAPAKRGRAKQAATA